jgi:hypothetical protein
MSNPQDKFFELKGKKGSVTIDTTTFTVRELRDKNEAGQLRLDHYQREYVYKEKKFEKASKVIETVLFGKVIPAIIVKVNEDNGSYEIIDGQQRVTSLLKFVENEFPLNLKDGDDASVLNGFMFKDMNFELKNVILNYRVTAMKVVTTNPEIVAEIFLDLNYQPIAVTSNEITTSIVYGNIAKEAKRLSRVGSGKFVDFPNIWKLFGHQTKYRKDGSFIIPAQDKGGSISLELLETMLSFVEKKIVLSKDRNWVRQQLIKSKNDDLSSYNLDNFEEISGYLNTLFNDEIMNQEKAFSPFFYIPEGKNRNVFLQPLAEITYLGLSQFNKSLDKLSDEQNNQIKEIFIKEIKPSAISFQNDENQLNEIKEMFINQIKEIIGE